MNSDAWMSVAGMVVDVVLAIAGMLFGWWLFNKWRTQVHAQASFESARNLVAAAHEARRAIEHYRASAAFRWEMEEFESKHAGDADRLKSNRELWWFIHSRRADAVHAALTDLSKARIALDVLLGPRLTTSLDGLEPIWRRVAGARLGLLTFEPALYLNADEAARESQKLNRLVMRGDAGDPIDSEVSACLQRLALDLAPVLSLTGNRSKIQ